MTSQRAADPVVQGLSGVRVLEFPHPKTAGCGRLLAQMGADVVLVEPPGGTSDRNLPPLAQINGEGLFFLYTNANKRSIVLDLDIGADHKKLLDLISKTDVLIDPFPPGHLAKLGLGDDALRSLNPSLIHASLSDFGQSGPFCDYKSSDIVAWAMSGLMSLTGDPNREPLVAPALQGYQVASIWLTIAVQAGIFRRVKTGQGARIDISLQEALFDMSETAHTFYLCNEDIVLRDSGDHPLACPFKVYKSKDGHAFISSSSLDQWRNLLAWMDETGVDTEAMRNPELDLHVGRVNHRSEVNAVVADFANRLGRNELFVEGAKRGIANGPVRTIPEVLEDNQLADREFFEEMDDYPYPGLPFRGLAGPWRTKSTPPPSAGSDTGKVIRDWSTSNHIWPEPTDIPRELPLEGINVLELCFNIAGPIMGRVLADLGATTIKLEPRELGEPGRLLVPFPNREPHHNRGYTFQDINRNKLSVPIDMKHEMAQSLTLRLVEKSDVLLNNFTAGTLERMRIPYDTLREVNDDVVVASITGYGQTGPRRGWPCNHPTSAALSGLTGLFAYEGGEPLGFGHSHMDYVSGYLGAVAVLDALLRREITGNGDHVDIAMVECGVTLNGAQLLDWAINGHVTRPMGNKSGALGAILQGCYPCKGEDRWVVVTVRDSENLRALEKTIGSKTGGSIQQLESALRNWTETLDAWVVTRELQNAGVAAGVVSQGPDLAERDQHLTARGGFSWITHAEIGTVPISQCAIFLDGRRLEVRTPAPLLAEHTETVLRGTAALSEEEYLGYVLADVV